MRYRLGLIAVAAGLSATVAAISFAAGPVVVSDNFDSGGYAGSTGSPGGAWLGPWAEVGEKDGPRAGAVRVQTASGCASKCLVVSGSLLYLGSGVTRTAEVQGTNDVTLTYSTYFGPLSTAVLQVQVNPDGKGWKTVAIRGESGTFTDVVGSVQGPVAVRLTVTGLGLTGSTGIDDVGFSFVPVSTTTTTTTGLDLPVPTITLPTITTTTVDPSTTTTTVTSASTTTTSSADTRITTTTRPDTGDIIGAPGNPPSSGDRDTTNPDAGPDTDSVRTRDDGVMVHLDPGLMPSRMPLADDVRALSGLSVPFGMRVEHLSLDLTLYVILGLILAAVSALRFEMVKPTHLTAKDDERSREGDPPASIS